MNIYIYIYYHVIYVLCVCVFFTHFLSNLYLYNTVLSVLFCVNKDIIIKILLENTQHQGPQYQKQCRTEKRNWQWWLPAHKKPTNAWTKPFITSMKEFTVATSANRDLERTYYSDQLDNNKTDIKNHGIS